MSTKIRDQEFGKPLGFDENSKPELRTYARPSIQVSRTHSIIKGGSGKDAEFVQPGEPNMRAA